MLHISRDNTGERYPKCKQHPIAPAFLGLGQPLRIVVPETPVPGEARPVMDSGLQHIAEHQGDGNRPADQGELDRMLPEGVGPRLRIARQQAARRTDEGPDRPARVLIEKVHPCGPVVIQIGADDRDEPNERVPHVRKDAAEPGIDRQKERQSQRQEIKALPPEHRVPDQANGLAVRSRQFDDGGFELGLFGEDRVIGDHRRPRACRMCLGRIHLEA